MLPSTKEGSRSRPVGFTSRGGCLDACEIGPLTDPRHGQPPRSHGGAPTTPGRRRRTVSLRHSGADPTCRPRGHIATDPEGRRVSTPPATVFGAMEEWEPFGSPLFRKVLPR